MRARAVLVLGLLLLAACEQPASPAATAGSPSPSLSASPLPTASPSPSPSPSASPTAAPTALPSAADVLANCDRQPGGDPLVLGLIGSPQTSLTVLDVKDPVQPVAACDVGPAAGGRFLPGGKVAFWTRDQRLEVYDPGRSTITVEGATAHVIDGGVFSPDGSSFAYRSTDAAGVTTLYLRRAGAEAALFSRPPVGGHGGPVGGPFSELAFSPDGQHLLIFDLFIAKGDPAPAFQVYSLDGRVELAGDYSMGAWSPVGQTSLYYLRHSTGNFSAGDIYDWTPGVADGQLYGGVASYNWPAWSPNHGIFFSAYDGSGYPRLWVIGRAGISQVSTTQSSHPFLVGGYVWTDQEAPCQCGPGGTSEPTGKVVARNLSTGAETVIALPSSLTPFADPIYSLLDYLPGS